MRLVSLAILAVLSLSACNSATPDENEVTTAENALGMEGDLVELPAGEGAAGEVADTDAWLGRWNGVEGTYVDIARGDAADRYRLTMQYTLDDTGTFDGAARENAIAFTRPDGKQALRPGDGADTGLKYLADKQDCLVVATGEGYCRD